MLREQSGIKQGQFADKIGITRMSMSNYESGKHCPDITILTDLADYYSCSVDYLLGRDEKIAQTAVSNSNRATVNNLVHALDTVTEDESDHLINGTTAIINSLSICKANTERRNFIQSIGKLLHLLAEYVEVSTNNEKCLLEHKRQNTLTPEMIAVLTAQMYGFDDINDVIEDIRRTGLKAAISFSVNAKKALRIRTGWRQNRQEGNNENNFVESSSGMVGQDVDWGKRH